MARAAQALVGRSREIVALRDGLLDGIEGLGSLWLITGEPGIGKSRLLEETARIAADHEVQVLWGRCWEAGGAPAYWPWIQLLRSLLERGADASAQQPLEAGELAELMPELEPTSGARAAPALEPEQARFRLMDAVMRTLRTMAQRTPLLLLLEDLHAADPSSLLLLDFVARQLRSCRLVVVGTLREAEALRGDSRPLFERLLAEGERIALTRLACEEVRLFLTRILDREPEADLTARVFKATEGNPLFVGELARLYVRSGALPGSDRVALPAGIRGTIRARLMLLSPSTRELLQTAAALGRECRYHTLAAVASTPQADLDAALDEAAAAEVLLETAPGLLRFSHVLLQQVLYGDLDDRRRQAVHARIAAQLEREGMSASERAHHWWAAGSGARQRAGEAALEAAREAEARHALSETAHWYGKALDAQTSAPAATRCDALLLLGHAQITAHELAAGRNSCQAAAALARELGDAERLARAALAYGAIYTIGEVQEPLVELLSEAMASLPQGDAPLRARVMARLAAAQQPATDPEPPIALAREAIAMARRCADAQTLLATIVAGCSAMMDLGDPAECRSLQEEHARLAYELGDLPEAFRAQLRLAFTAYELGDHERAGAAIVGCASLAETLSQPHYRWRVEALHALRETAMGRFAAAREHMERARLLGLRAGDPNAARTYASQRLAWLRLQGRKVEIVAAVSELDRLLPSAMSALAGASAFRGGYLGWAGELSGARACHARLWPGSALLSADATLLDPMVELAVAVGDAELMQSLYERALPRRARWTTSGVFGFTWDRPVLVCLGRLAAGLGRLSEAARHYREALAMMQGCEVRAHQAWAAQEAAAVHARLGEHEQARVLHARAEALAAELGISLPPAQPAGSAAATSQPPAGSPRPLLPEVAFFALTREGDYWAVRCAERVFRVKDAKGIAMLARLVESEGQELHVLDLVSPDGAIDGGDAGELLDSRAREQYRARVRELRDELDQAEAHSDLGTAERAREELEQIANELSRGVGLGGKGRRAGAAAERARVNVQRRLRDAIAKLSEQDAQLGRHLEWAVRTGTYCSYRTGERSSRDR